ncbi:MAG: S8 family peptidase [Methanomethylovorans sp.]|uniref:S8 family peptidase n=1 Tax=Methanomethylovorans sp. TaxID=2758717 RepID=UPI0035317A5D
MKLHIGNWILTLIVVCSMIMLAVPASALVDASSDDILEKSVDVKDTEKYVPGEILVKFKPGLSDKEIKDINAKHETSVLYTSPYAGFKTLKVPKTKTVEEMAEIYSKNPNVEYAVPNYLMYATGFVPNDYYYDLQWNFNSQHGINVEQAWPLSTGRGVVVAVIDTGVKKTAPDLANTKILSGYDFVNRDTNPDDDNGHGTHVTGTIAQSTNNGIGVAGVAYGCTIMPVKVLNAKGSGTLSQLVDGVSYASNNGADVISMSLGFPPSVTAESLIPLGNAINSADSKNIVIVAAAGNDGISTVGYPAAYEECIAVGATRYDGTRAYYSNYGDALDIMAPGGDLNVDQSGDGYGDGILQNTFNPKTGTFSYYFYQGTSMATPHVSGVAALLIADGVKPENVRTAIESTANMDTTAGYGCGIVDAYQALYDYSPISGPTDQVSIEDVTVTCTPRTVRKNTLVTAKATITIVDTSKTPAVPIQGATVSGKWSGATTDSDIGLTDSSGQVIFYSNEVKVLSTAKFTFTVNDISVPYTIPWDGAGASNSITYPK